MHRASDSLPEKEKKELLSAHASMANVCQEL